MLIGDLAISLAPFLPSRFASNFNTTPNRQTMYTTVTANEKFENVTPSALYNLFLDSAKLAEITGAPASGGNKVGDTYSNYDGYCTGKYLHLIPGELIVQTWHGAGFVDQDSILVLRFEASGNNTFVHMAHTNVTNDQSQNMAADWRAFFWDKYRAHLAGKPVSHEAVMM
jgi:activator of HSP90 ATPase